MQEVQILVPVASNSGEAFTEGHHRAFEALLADTFGGFTREAGLATGAWVEGGKTFHDSLRVYVIFVDGLLARSEDVLAVIALAKTHYGQLAMTVRYQGIAEIL